VAAVSALPSDTRNIVGVFFFAITQSHLKESAASFNLQRF
jgi:hypothetical protein